MRVAIFGGSFNPVHIGHLVIAENVRCTLGYDKVLFVPVNIPPHKELALGASGAERLQMLHMALSSNPFFCVEECEIRRGGVSYTYDTLVDLNMRFEKELEGKIGLVIGDDHVEGFETWNRFQQIPDLADIILARRVVYSKKDSIAFKYPHVELSNSILPVSSSEIRQQIRSFGTSGAWRYLVPDSVYQYIIHRNLYGCKTD